MVCDRTRIQGAGRRQRLTDIRHRRPSEVRGRLQRLHYVPLFRLLPRVVRAGHDGSVGEAPTRIDRPIQRATGIMAWIRGCRTVKRTKRESCEGAKKEKNGSRRDAERSEEHTSELQSLMRISYAVFCLKKKSTARQRQEGQ